MYKAVVTGMGCVSGLGADCAATWNALAAGHGAIRAIDVPAGDGNEATIHCAAAPAAANALDCLNAHFDDKQLTADPFSNFAAAATLEALKDAGLYGNVPELTEAAIIYGTASGGNASIEAGYRRMFMYRLSNVHPMTIPRYMGSAAVSHLSMLFGVRGHCIGISSACASSAHAIAEAMHFIRAGRGPIAIAGGSDASLTFGSLQAWKALQAMAPDTCRPFSIDRKGMILGEGAATIILEEEGHALRRGAKIYAEVAGASSMSDARHITQPDAERSAATVKAAYDDAGLSTDDECLISAHGTGTRLNDRAETTALRLVYDNRLAKHRVIATKSAHAHMLGASGAMEFLIAVKALNEKTAPPILGYLGFDPECDLPLVLQPTAIDCDIAVSTSFAFGGLNSVLIAKLPSA